MSTAVVAVKDRSELPPILAGAATPDIRERVKKFYVSVADIFESWVARRKSPHTQRGYREDFMAYVAFLGVRWPEQATMILSASVRDAQAFRDRLVSEGKAPK